MKLLVLPRYSRLGASSRLRMMQYFPWLESAGVEVTVAPFFSDAYVQGLQAHRRGIGDVVSSYFRRVRAILGSGQFDLIWIEKEMLPWLPASLEFALMGQRVPYVLDYDDAVFHYYDQHRNPLVKMLLGSKHSRLIKGAALIIAGNAYLADYAQHAGAEHVEIIPTVIDLERYTCVKEVHNAQKTLPPSVGWIGQRASVSNLFPYKELFNGFSCEGKARFSAIGIDAQALGLPMHSLPWSEQSEVSDIKSFDIGIMPLVDEPFERGKCGYKLIQYMACGLPVIASPVGVNNQLVKHGVNGFLAETVQEWSDALGILLCDHDLRQKMGREGRLIVERDYSLQVMAPRLTELILYI